MITDVLVYAYLLGVISGVVVAAMGIGIGWSMAARGLRQTDQEHEP